MKPANSTLPPDGGNLSSDSFLVRATALLEEFGLSRSEVPYPVAEVLVQIVWQRPERKDSAPKSIFDKEAALKELRTAIEEWQRTSGHTHHPKQHQAVNRPTELCNPTPSPVNEPVDQSLLQSLSNRNPHLTP